MPSKSKKVASKTIGVGRARVEKQCLLCGYTAKGEIGIRLHLKQSHGVGPTTSENSKTSEKCNACKREFENEKELIKHMKKENCAVK